MNEFFAFWAGGFLVVVFHMWLEFYAGKFPEISLLFPYRFWLTLTAMAVVWPLGMCLMVLWQRKQNIDLREAQDEWDRIEATRRKFE